MTIVKVSLSSATTCCARAVFYTRRSPCEHRSRNNVLFFQSDSNIADYDFFVLVISELYSIAHVLLVPSWANRASANARAIMLGAS